MGDGQGGNPNPTPAIFPLKDDSCLVYSVVDSSETIESVPLLRGVLISLNDFIFFYYRPHPKDDGRLYFQSVHTFGGGPQVQVEWGSQVQVGGSQSQIQGGSQSQIQGGSQSQIWGGSQSQIWGGYPVSVKGKIFDTRFGLIHVQTGKKIFVEGLPPHPPSKGKIF